MSATNRGADRNPRDFYPTPNYSIDSILQELDISKVTSFGEPCRGDGAIYDRFSVHEKIECYYTELSEGLSYFDYDFNVDLIVTNPPFSLAQEFLEKSLTEAKTIVYLLRLNFLGSQKRKVFWQGKEPTHLFVLSKRPSFTGKGTDATEYAWFVWDTAEIVTKPKGIYII